MARGLTILRPEIVEVSDDGSTYWEVPGVGTISKSGGEGSQTQILAINGVGSIAESPGVPTWTISLEAYSPNAKAMQILENAADSQNVVYYRLSTSAEVELKAVKSGDTVAIATTGVCTFAPANSVDFTAAHLGRLGLRIKVTGNTSLFTISGLTSAGAVTVTDAPATAVAAATYSVVVPATRESGTGTVSAAGNYDGGPGAALTGSFTLVPDARNKLQVI